MTKNIVPYTDEQKAQISAKTGYVPPTVTPVIKFNADKKEGKWYRTTGKLDETTGESIYEEIDSDSVTMHVVACNRKVIQSGDKATTRVTSGEVGFYDSFISLTPYGEKESIASGDYNTLKKNHPEYDLYFSRVLYVFYDNKPYKFYLSGAKAYAFSDYYKLGDPALVETIVSKGELYTNEQGRKYYKVEFKKGDVLPLDVINKRIDDVNEYLKRFNDSILVANKEESDKPRQIADTSDEPFESKPEPEVSMADVENIPL